MEFESVGSRCYQCNAQDSVPFTCKSCNNKFCLTHSTQIQHKCPYLSNNHSHNRNTNTKTSAPSKKTSYKCAFHNCNSGDEVSATKCKACGYVYCLSHRYNFQHNCKSNLSKILNKRKLVLLAQVLIVLMTFFLSMQFVI